MSLNIIIRSVPHSQQRYETIGDWFYLDNGDLHIVVSDMGNWKLELLVARHELDEAMLCKARGITLQVVDKFDMDYETNRNPSDTISEPGDDPKAPYYNEHFFATTSERLMARELGVSWRDYEETIQKLSSNSDDTDDSDDPITTD